MNPLATGQLCKHQDRPEDNGWNSVLMEPGYVMDSIDPIWSYNTCAAVTQASPSCSPVYLFSGASSGSMAVTYPQMQQNLFVFHPYIGASENEVNPAFANNYENDGSWGIQHAGDARQRFVEEACNQIPPIKPELRTVPTTSPISGSNELNFGTKVDTLMKVIHTRIQSTTPQKSASTSQGKPYKCNVGNCTKSFKSRYDLREHYRTHTGEKPYQCTKSGCDSKFSALGNLKTHERQHTNERPYKCEKCDWAFTRKFTLTVHQKTHELIRPSYYVCPLDYCFKQFRRLGNLKTHHNKTHAVTIGRLTDQFASIKDGDIESAADKDKELWDYFTNLYKNSSKGMKLRGKDREVKGADGGHSMVGTGREN